MVLAPKNECDNKRFALTLQTAPGQYIACLDGDDYWTSPHKLQKQVNFLDNHLECSICFHNVDVVYDDGSIETHPFHMQEPRYSISTFEPKQISTLEDLVGGNFLQTCSVMFRNRLFDEIPDWYYGLLLGDCPLHILNADHVKIG